MRRATHKMTQANPRVQSSCAQYGALALLIFCVTAASLLVLNRASAGPALTDVTQDAAQPIYYDGSPHTDWSGNLRTSYDPALSLFPRGMYYTEPCRSTHSFSWPRFTNASHPNWSTFANDPLGKQYDIIVQLGAAPTNDEARTQRCTPSTRLERVSSSEQ
jgi:hypothetical protein